MYRVRFEELLWETCGEGVRHKLRRGEGPRLRWVEYSTSRPMQWCQRGHIGKIISGCLEIEFSAGTYIFEDGDCLEIPAGDAHRHRARLLTPTVVALFVESDAD